MAVLKNPHIKKRKFHSAWKKKKSYEVHSCYGDSPCSVFRRSQWGEGQEAMGVRLAPSRRCPHCHFWAPVVKAQSGKNPTDQTPGTTDISCFYSRVSKPQKLLPLAFLHPSLYCPSILLWLRRILRCSWYRPLPFARNKQCWQGRLPEGSSPFSSPSLAFGFWLLWKAAGLHQLLSANMPTILVFRAWGAGSAKFLSILMYPLVGHWERMGNKRPGSTEQTATMLAHRVMQGPLTFCTLGNSLASP